MLPANGASSSKKCTPADCLLCYLLICLSTNQDLLILVKIKYYVSVFTRTHDQRTRGLAKRKSLPEAVRV